jgi:hypothetical protein
MKSFLNLKTKADKPLYFQYFFLPDHSVQKQTAGSPAACQGLRPNLAIA